MIHLRIIAPATLAARALELLSDLQFVTNIIILRGVGLRLEGDTIFCNIAGEGASHVIADLRDLGIDRHGSIVIGPPETELSRLVPETGDTNRASDAVVWEEVEERTSEGAELSPSFLLFMIIAVLIAMIGIYINSSILIIGAMIVGPDFGPIAGVCVAAVSRQLAQAGKSLLALVAGYTSGIAVAYLMTLILRKAELIQPIDPIDRFVEISMIQPGFFPVLVALLAGTAGMLSLTTARSGALIGVLVSVTTIPAAANVAVTIAYSQEEAFYASILQLVTNIGAMLLAGTLTLGIQRMLLLAPPHCPPQRNRPPGEGTNKLAVGTCR